MPGDSDFRQSGERIERLLEELRGMAGRPALDRIDQLIRLIVELYGAGLARIVDALCLDASIEEIRKQLLKDELIASLLVLHGLHPKDLATRVSEALEQVRPYLGSHGGDVELLAIDEAAGSVKLRLDGSCDGCPFSMVTVKLAVEGAIKELAPEITRIEVEGLADGADGPRPVESLLAKAHANGNGTNGKVLPQVVAFVARRATQHLVMQRAIFNQRSDLPGARSAAAGCIWIRYRCWKMKAA